MGISQDVILHGVLPYLPIGDLYKLFQVDLTLCYLANVEIGNRIKNDKDSVLEFGIRKRDVVVLCDVLQRIPRIWKKGYSWTNYPKTSLPSWFQTEGSVWWATKNQCLEVDLVEFSIKRKENMIPIIVYLADVLQSSKLLYSLYLNTRKISPMIRRKQDKFVDSNYGTMIGVMVSDYQDVYPKFLRQVKSKRNRILLGDILSRLYVVRGYEAVANLCKKLSDDNVRVSNKDVHVLVDKIYQDTQDIDKTLDILDILQVRRIKNLTPIFTRNIIYHTDLMVILRYPSARQLLKKINNQTANKIRRCKGILMQTYSLNEIQILCDELLLFPDFGKILSWLELRAINQ